MSSMALHVGGPLRLGRFPVKSMRIHIGSVSFYYFKRYFNCDLLEAKAATEVFHKNSIVTLLKAALLKIFYFDVFGLWSESP